MRQTAIAIGFTIGPAIGGGLYSVSFHAVGCERMTNR